MEDVKKYDKVSIVIDGHTVKMKNFTFCEEHVPKPLRVKKDHRFTGTANVLSMFCKNCGEII